MIFPTLWAYRTLVKNATDFTAFHLVHRMEFVLSIECEIPSLKLAIEILPGTTFEEECLLHLQQLEKHHRDTVMSNEAH